MEKLETTLITFPQIKVVAADGHRLRGCIADMFKEKSDLLHNHFEDGSSIYRYPLVQYKVIQGIPHILGFNEGAHALMDVFAEANELRIGDRVYTGRERTLDCYYSEIGATGKPRHYTFVNPWMALNQEKHKDFKALGDDWDAQKALLEKALVNNIIAFCKGVGYRETERIEVSIKNARPVQANFKGNPMMAFRADFDTDFALPQMAGLGKSAARGFGAIKRI